jgi:hypothetical protein
MVAVERLGSGDHACLFFDSHEDRWALRAAFATDGLARGERVMFFVGPGTHEGEALDRLASFGVPVEGAADGRGRVDVIRTDPGYAPGIGFDPVARTEYWEAVSRETSARGFTGLRTAGDMAWAAAPEVDGEQLVAYEAGLTPLLPAMRFTAMCEYDRAVFAGAAAPELMPGGMPEGMPERVLATHPLTVLPEPGALHASLHTSMGAAPGTSPPTSLDASREGDVLRLAGDADLATRGAFERAVRRPGPDVIDLTGLGFIDAYCVQVLLRLGGGVRLECTAAQARLLGLCGAPGGGEGMVRVRAGQGGRAARGGGPG